MQALLEISMICGCSINYPPGHRATGKCTCAMVYKIGILGNLPIAHNRFWRLCLWNKKSNLRMLYTVLYMVSEILSGPQVKTL
jgi:hypothetical protein